MLSKGCLCIPTGSLYAPRDNMQLGVCRDTHTCADLQDSITVQQSEQEKGLRKMQELVGGSLAVPKEVVQPGFAVLGRCHVSILKAHSMLQQQLALVAAVTTCIGELHWQPVIHCHTAHSEIKLRPMDKYTDVDLAFGWTCSCATVLHSKRSKVVMQISTSHSSKSFLVAALVCVLIIYTACNCDHQDRP